MKYLKKISFNAPVTLSFTIICLIVVILGALTHNATTYSLFTIFRTSFLDPLLYVRLFTHVLGHIDFSHFANNMTLFLLTAPLLEEKYGSKRLLFIILFVAFITGLINVIFTHNYFFINSLTLYYNKVVRLYKKHSIKLLDWVQNQILGEDSTRKS